MRLEWIFIMQIALGILMLIFLRKQMEMKKQVDEITKEVSNYISYITEDVDRAVTEENQSIKSQQKKGKEEVQNRLIQAVLSEYFP